MEAMQMVRALRDVRDGDAVECPSCGGVFAFSARMRASAQQHVTDWERLPQAVRTTVVAPSTTVPCGYCHANVCLLCERKGHAPRTCEGETLRTLQAPELRGQRGITPCWRCGTPLLKYFGDGCHELVCRGCGQSTCAACGRKQQPHTFCAHGCKRFCTSRGPRCRCPPRPAGVAELPDTEGIAAMAAWEAAMHGAASREEGAGAAAWEEAATQGGGGTGVVAGGSVGAATQNSGGTGVVAGGSVGAASAVAMHALPGSRADAGTRTAGVTRTPALSRTPAVVRTVTRSRVPARTQAAGVGTTAPNGGLMALLDAARMPGRADAPTTVGDALLAGIMLGQLLGTVMGTSHEPSGSAATTEARAAASPPAASPPAASPPAAQIRTYGSPLLRAPPRPPRIHRFTSRQLLDDIEEGEILEAGGEEASGVNGLFVDEEVDDEGDSDAEAEESDEEEEDEEEGYGESEDSDSSSGVFSVALDELE